MPAPAPSSPPARPDPVLNGILGEVASQRRDWPTAETAFAHAHAAAPTDEHRFKRDTATMYRRLSPLLEPSPAGRRGQGEDAPPRRPVTFLSRRPESGTYAIAFLNLDRNPERETELRRQFAASAPPLHRSPGIEGRRLPAAAITRLGADPHMRGTLGCFLSHAAAWEAMLDRADPYCLVVEDDVIPLLDLPATLDAFHLPPGFDIVFVNDRLSPRLDPAATTAFTTRPLAAAMHAFPPDDNAPGGDGYILSRAGAAKLLAWVAADGFAEDVDWRLIAYGLAPTAIAALPRPSHAAPWLDRLSRIIGRPDRLDAHVLHPPLIRTVGVSSDREDENRLHPCLLP